MSELKIIDENVLNELVAMLQSRLDRLSRFCVSIGINPTEWLDTHEVCKLLDASKQTLQKLRSSGILPCSRVGSKMFYDAEDVKKMLSVNDNTPIKKEDVRIAFSISRIFACSYVSESVWSFFNMLLLCIRLSAERLTILSPSSLNLELICEHGLIEK